MTRTRIAQLKRLATLDDLLAAQFAECLKNTGADFRDVRGTLELTQPEMAGRLKIAPTHLCRIERGKASPGVDLLKRLAGMV